MINTVVQAFEQIWNAIATIMGMSPVLLIPTFLIVELVSALSGLKSHAGIWRNSIIGVLCMLSGALVVWSTMELANVRLYVQNGIILGSLSAITYQIVKPLFQFGVLLLFKYIRKRTGDDSLNDPDFLAERDEKC
jgi:hypothetical protein